MAQKASPNIWTRVLRKAFALLQIGMAKSLNVKSIIVYRREKSQKEGQESEKRSDLRREQKMEREGA